MHPKSIIEAISLKFGTKSIDRIKEESKHYKDIIDRNFKITNKMEIESSELTPLLTNIKANMGTIITLMRAF
jgi:hypothetical protein